MKRFSDCLYKCHSKIAHEPYEHGLLNDQIQEMDGCHILNMYYLIDDRISSGCLNLQNICETSYHTIQSEIAYPELHTVIYFV